MHMKLIDKEVQVLSADEEQRKEESMLQQENKEQKSSMSNYNIRNMLIETLKDKISQ